MYLETRALLESAYIMHDGITHGTDLRHNIAHFIKNLEKILDLEEE